MTSAVIYEHWKDPKKEEEIAKIIEEIKKHQWFVSVEAKFSNFDYVLASEEGYKVIYRNEETAFLTPHLRKYGGDGYYNQYKLGQLIRGIVFCGKGLVRRPANAESVILSNYTESIAKPLGYITSSAEIISKEKSEMSDELKNENTQLKQTVANLEAQLKGIAEKNVEAQISELKEQIKGKDAKLVEAQDKLTANATEIIELKKANQDTVTKLATASAELEKVALNTKKGDRAKILAKEIGVTIEDADSLVENLVSLNDEQFTKFITASKERLEVKKPQETKPVETATEKVEGEAATQVLETATASKDAAMTTAAAATENVRKTVKNFLSKRESK